MKIKFSIDIITLLTDDLDDTIVNSLFDQSSFMSGKLYHAKWSGFGIWMPLPNKLNYPTIGDFAHHCKPGDILMYDGKESEPELFIAYNVAAFSSVCGPLSAFIIGNLHNHIAEINNIGKSILETGAKPCTLTKF